MDGLTTEDRETKMENHIGELAGDLAKAQAEMKNAAFDSVNPHYKNQYASLAAVRDAALPVLAKHNLSVVQTTRMEPQFQLVTTLLHKSGATVESVYPLEVANPQAMGSQLTYARRYCLLAIAGIAGDEDDDAEAAQKTAKPGDSVRAAAAKPEWLGPLNKTALKQKSRDYVNELGLCEDEGALIGLWKNKEMQAVLKQMEVDAPDFYEAVLEAKDLAKERCAEAENNIQVEALKAG